MRCLTVLIGSMLLVGCGPPESTFTLGMGSRPPKWCPAGSTTVTMSYYVRSDGREAKVKCSLSSGTLTGRLRGEQPTAPKQPPPGFPKGYPIYEVVTINGVTDIVEHRRMEPYFFMIDESAVSEELRCLLTSSCSGP